MLAFMLCRTEIHQWMYVFYFRFLQAFGHRSFAQGLPTRAGLERVGKKPPHLPIVLSPETPPKFPMFQGTARPLHSKHQEPASFATGSVLLPARENRPTAIQVTIIARSDDHPHHSTQTSLFFPRLRRANKKKRIISKKNFTKTRKSWVTSVSSICNFESELPKNQPNP